MYQNILQEADLTPKEAQIYEIILGLGEVPVKDVISQTGDHPHVVYRIIEGLAASGLISVFIRNKKKYVSSNDPALLEQRIEKKLNSIQEIMPALLQMRKGDSSASVNVFKGNEGIRTVREKIIKELPDNGEYYIIVATDNTYYKIMGYAHKELDRKRIKKGIQRKNAGFCRQREDASRK